MATSFGRLALAYALAATVVAQAAPIVTLGGYKHDLNQFTGANVTTTATNAEIDGKNWDNAVGVDNYTLGELATAQFGVDPGDTIALGDGTRQRALRLTYGTGFTVGTGDARFFVVYELKSADNLTPDTEGTAFEISFNGGSWVSAITGRSFLNVIPVNEYHHQVGFDLTSAQFGFGIGQSITTVDIRNITGLGTSSDPDFTFAAHAMNPVSVVPDGGSSTILLLAATIALAFLRKRLA